MRKIKNKLIVLVLSIALVTPVVGSISTNGNTETVVGAVQVSNSKAKSESELRNIVLNEYPGKVQYVEKGYRRGSLIYKYYILQDTGFVVEVKITANTGIIFDVDYGKKYVGTGYESIKSEEELRKIVLASYPGNITKVEFDYDDGLFVYEYKIKLASNGKKVEVKINAYNGKIIEVDF